MYSRATSDTAKNCTSRSRLWSAGLSGVGVAAAKRRCSQDCRGDYHSARPAARRHRDRTITPVRPVRVQCPLGKLTLGQGAAARKRRSREAMKIGQLVRHAAPLACSKSARHGETNLARRRLDCQRRVTRSRSRGRSPWCAIDTTGSHLQRAPASERGVGRATAPPGGSEDVTQRRSCVDRLERSRT
jgi:hypothetical protein